MSMIKNLIETKYFPREIGVVGYTRAAVAEVKNRVATSRQMKKEMDENVRTIHSHCLRLLGIPPNNIADSHLADFNRDQPAHAFTATTKNTEDTVLNQGNHLINRNGMLHTEVDLKRNLRTPYSEWTDLEKAHHEAWQEWLAKNSYIDFTGMLEQALEQRLCPANIRVLFVDESQDLTPLQFDVTEFWGSQLERGIFAGDSDQCIYRYAGALPQRFIELPRKDQTVLGQSYRVPEAVHDYSQKVIKQIRYREAIDYYPTEIKGEVVKTKYPDLNKPGSHMILVRCNYQANFWKEWLSKAGLLWHNPYRLEDLAYNPTATKEWKALKTWERLDQWDPDDRVPMQDVIEMTELVIAKNNLRPKAKTAIIKHEKKQLLLDYADGIPMVELWDIGFLEPFVDENIPLDKKIKITTQAGKMALKRIQDKKTMDIEPAVILGTIHSVKGGEADNVWLDISIPNIIYRNIRRDNDARADELRVLYVACTRARHTLGLLHTKARHHPLLP
jgi:superfamily I DNA/RNA helicase